MARWLQSIARTALNTILGKSNGSTPSAPQKLGATVKSGTCVSTTCVSKAPCARTTPLSPKEAFRAKKLAEERAWNAMLDDFLKNPSTHQRLAPYA